MTQDWPLLYWMQAYRQEALEEFMRLEGRGNSSRLVECMSCLGREHATEPIFRCKECLGMCLECQDCVVERHRQTPFHIIQELFRQGDLAATWVYAFNWALTRQGRCLNPRPGPIDFSVLHVNGLHQLAIDFCWCEHRVAPWKQLLRAELFPATVDQPRTCASFRLLEQYQALSGSGKISAYEFHQALSHMTDATGISKPKSKYTSLGRMVRQFAHMKMMKRAGRGNVSDGIKTTAPGQLATLCPACPHPGINLPADWESAPLEFKFLYILILALDANFRLKNLYRSSWDKDPGLHTGLVYFVEPTKYLKHMTNYATQKDISTCSGFRTLSHAESKNAVGLRATGVRMCICARHEIVHPLGIGDLQKGERYCNMDYIALSASKNHGVQVVFYSYDIACQWKINFFKRVTAFSKDWQIPEGVEVCFGIPKCHCKGHKRPCQCRFSMNIQIVGRTDGEGIERTWAEVNMVANSTKEMGPGNQVIGLGRLFAKKHVKARNKAARHMSGFIALTEVLPDEGFKAQWTAEIEAWERDQDLPSPYMIDIKHLTETEVVYSLKEEERKTAVRDGLAGVDSNVTLCVELGLIVEDTQRRLRQDIRDQEEEVPLAVSKDIQKKRKALHKDLTRLRSLQGEYMPCVKAKLRETINDSRDVEDRKLWMPSELDPTLRVKGCLSGVADIETKLHEAQCQDALSSLRSTLRARHSLFSRRNKNFRGQKQNTRVADTAHRLDRQCRLAGAKYNAARAALISLKGPGTWETELRELRNSDMVSLHGSLLEIDKDNEEDDDAEGNKRKKRPKTGPPKEAGEGHREISWIWMQEGALGDGSNKDLNHAIKLEWLRSHARAHRWREECLLLTEEKRHVLKTFTYEAERWDQQQSGWPDLDREHAEGVRAYALRQADIYRRLAARFRTIWDLPAEEVMDDDDSESEAEEEGRVQREAQQQHGEDTGVVI
ncbi:hypothetical protein EV421DRAFT_1903278 [Armillaria borealis]|uniref:CxC2-like cysteine cluster KDZ transposase-associated domain-containing protein n=1 Tax=Armillaria borealis TaxID=47425 RepID=A0AA39MSG9_9AGAR|nr:hypothetical protein EV421DRAFT_1903278 [Armillaria borealis]